ncbi:response regulator [Paenibacillus chibensis]|uniref:Response regulator n=1 Tax=Paenibacillus chibensis TaxID=59846 RepID=A0ABU6PQK0_9BACL|nr:response regulator [Paenibacillus chibensis]
MPTVLIVDDESIFRKGLRHLITEMDSSWDIVGEARHGAEALEIIKQHAPDLVITDIRMPQMDGIELQNAVKEKYPHIAFVVLSGYGEFHYARESLRLGARDYLLKPIEKEELRRTLNQAYQEWAAQREADAAEAWGTETLRQMRDPLLQGFLHGSLHAHSSELLEHAGICFPHAGWYCLAANLDRDSVEDQRYSRSDPSLFTLYISQFMQEFLDQSDQQILGYAFPGRNGHVAAIINMPVTEEGEARLAQLARTLIREVKVFSNLTITIGIGSGAHDLESISGSYQQAEMALLYRLVTGGDRVIAYGQAECDRRTAADGDGLYNLKLLDQNVQEGTLERVRYNVRDWVGTLFRQTNDPKEIQRRVCHFLLHYYEIAVNRSVEMDWAGNRHMKQIMDEVFSFYSRKELEAYCEDLLVRLHQLIHQKGSGPAVHAVDAAVDYLTKHYAEAVTLSQVAEHVFLNPSYLSSLFKSTLGCSFIEFLTQKRMEEACRRLQYTDDKVAAIAEQTGFANVRHFNRVFKDQTGRTPKQYREARGEIQIEIP